MTRGYQDIFCLFTERILKIRNNFHFTVNGNVANTLKFKFHSLIWLPRGYCRLIIMLRLGWSGSVVWSLGDEALKSFQSYFWSRPCPLLAFAYTWMLSQLAKVWLALVTKASRLNLILASLWELSPFQSFFLRFNWNCHSPSKLWFERWKSLNAFAWRDLVRAHSSPCTVTATSS